MWKLEQLRRRFSWTSRAADRKQETGYEQIYLSTQKEVRFRKKLRCAERTWVYRKAASSALSALAPLAEQKKTCRQHCGQLFFAEGLFLTHRDKLPMILPSLEVRVWATAVHCNFVSCQQFAPFRQKSKILELPFYASIPHKCFTKGTGNRSLNTRRKFPVK